MGPSTTVPHREYNEEYRSWMCEYRYPDVRVQVPGCVSTGTWMWEYRYPDVGVQVPGCGSTGTLDVGVQVRMGQIFSAELL